MRETVKYQHRETKAWSSSMPPVANVILGQMFSLSEPQFHYL